MIITWWEFPFLLLRFLLEALLRIEFYKGDDKGRRNIIISNGYKLILVTTYLGTEGILRVIRLYSEIGM